MSVSAINLEQLGGHKAFGFAIRAHAALLVDGTADETASMIGWDTKAVIALDGGEIIGIITYDIIKWRGDLAVGVGYVIPQHRGAGVYRLMWNDLVKEAKTAKCGRIYGAIKVGNTEMRAIAAKLGREEESINVIFRVPDTAPTIA